MIDDEHTNPMNTEATLDQAVHAPTSRQGSALVAEQVWGMLRGLGVDRGQLLVSGTDPAVFAGAPIPNAIATGELVAAIPPADWPHTGIRLAPRTQLSPEQYDVIIYNSPHVDLRARHPQNTSTLLDLHSRMILKAMHHTNPGGITVAITSHQVLDAPDAKHRHQMLALSDLVGAARLPSSLLHPEHSHPENTQPDGVPGPAVDLLVFRRRIDGDPMKTMPFIFISPTMVDDTATIVNEYYDEMPEDILGTPHLTQDDMGTALTVAHDDQHARQALHAVLTGIARRGNARGLTAGATSSSSPDGPLAPGADLPRRRPTAPNPWTTIQAGRPDDAPAPGPGL